MAKVKFWKGTSASYSAITTKDSNTLYYLTDTGRIYVGSSLVGSKEQGTSNLTIGTTATTAAAGNHTHSIYQPLISQTNKLSYTLIDGRGGFCGGNVTKWGRIYDGSYSGSGTVDTTTTFLVSDYYTTSNGLMAILMVDMRGNSKTAIQNTKANWVYKTKDFSELVKITSVYEGDAIHIRVYVKGAGWGESINMKILNSHSWSGSGGITWSSYSATYAGGAVETFDSIPSNETLITITDKQSLTPTSSAAKWTTARTLSLTGSVTGSASIDGSGNVILATTTNHTHSYLPLSGGTMTGALTLSGAPTSNLHAATKKYVDDNKYTHPTGDGNLHVPTTGTTNNGKVLTAGSTAGSLSWTSLPTLAKGTTTGSGNAVTDISVNGHTITLTKGTTFLTAHQSIKTINSVALTGSGNITFDTLGVAAKSHTHSYIPLSGSSAITGDLISNNGSSLGSLANIWEEIHGNDIYATGNIYLGGTGINFLFASSGHTHSTYIPKTLTSAKGDIIYASAANTPARLAVGANGKYLKVVNGVPAWADVTVSWSGGTVTSSVTPNSNKTLNLGSNSLRWNNAYIHSMQTSSIYDEDGTAYIQFTSNNEMEFSGFGFTFYDDVHVDDYYVYADGFEQTSDRTLKTELSDVRLTLEQICSLPSKRFYFTKDDAQRPRVGTYAQDVQRILPEVVGQSKSGTLTLDYSTLGTVIGLSLAKEVEKLRLRVEELEAMLRDKTSQ